MGVMLVPLSAWHLLVMFGDQVKNSVSRALNSNKMVRF